MKNFGEYIRSKRSKLQEKDKSFSQRQVSLRIGIEPSYLSKIERGLPVALSEEKIVALAEVLGEDSDYLLALGGKISGDVQEIIKKRAMLFSRLVRGMKDLPDEAIEENNEFKQVQGQLHRLHDLASISAFQFCADTEKSYWTRQAPSILRIDQDTTPCMDSIIQALDPVERQRFHEARELALKNTEAFHCELKLASPRGTPGYIQIWGYFEADEGLDETSVLGIIQDTTEIVQLRNEIQAANDSLQTTFNEQGLKLSTAIEKLTAEINSRRELEIQLKKMNEEITEQANIQNSFFKDRAYSLRSLMNKFISEQSVAGTNKSHALNINRISSKINDMGDFLASKQGLSPEEGSFNPNEVLTTTFTEFEADFKLNKINLSSFTAPDLPDFVVSDKRRLEQVLTALLEMFLLNTPWGYVHISASIEPESNSLALSMASPSKNKPVEMDSFYPGSPSGVSAYESSPAQLVGPLLDMLNGTISIDNPMNVGVLINILIPIKIADPQRVPEEKETLGKNILVVEDDKHSLLYISKVLENRGYEVTSTANGEEALKESSSKEFEAILLDIQLPDINGIQVSDTIRRNPDSPNQKTPIIAVTAHATPADRERYATAGFDGFIPKPFEIDALTEELTKHIKTN